MPSSSKDASLQGPLGEADRCVREMEELEDYYFGADKEAKLAELAAAVVASVEQSTMLPSEGSRPQDVRLRGLLLRGRAAALVPGRERSAEELLSKAIKLDPQRLDAWNWLGEVYWNLHDATQARQCFEQAIELCGANPVSLRNLSMALRALDGGDQRTRRDNFSAALAKAKEAVALDPKDPLSWETLGNAYVGDFFVNARRPDEINRALIAYDKAEAAYDKLGKRNPTLHFNRGMAAKYIEDYQLALRSFGQAHEMGAGAAAEEGRRVFDLVRRLAALVERRHDLKAKRLKELTSDLPDGPQHRTLKELQAGEGGEVPLQARVLSLMQRKDEVPVILVCCDSSGDVFALSIYNAELQRLAEAVTPMKSVLSVRAARFRQVSVVSPDAKEWTYPSVTVGHPAEVTLGSGETLAPAAVQSMVFSTGADRATTEHNASLGPNGWSQATSRGGQPGMASLAEHQERLCRVAKEAKLRGGGRGEVIKALLPALHSLVEAELGEDAGRRLGRIDTMFSRMARGEVHVEEDEVVGRRYAPGFLDGLTPNAPFHNDQDLPWCAELKRHWTEIRAELHSHLHEAAIWVPGAYADSNKAYAPDWKIAGVLVADTWQDDGRWSTTQGIIRRLKGITPFEVFFARMPPHSTIAAHSDNLNYILTSHLALELEPGMCSLRVGNQERDWEEGEMLVFDTTYIHSAWNDSSRNRYVLVLRFWHPDLTLEERRAIHLSHTLLAATPDPESQRAAAASMSMAT